MSSDLNIGNIPVACDLTALTHEQREQHQRARQMIMEAVQEVQELPNGYALRFAPEPALLRVVGEFIALERLCCPFFDFALEVRREHGPAWLRLTGGQGVKAFLQHEMSVDPGISR